MSLKLGQSQDTDVMYMDTNLALIAADNLPGSPSTARTTLTTF